MTEPGSPVPDEADEGNGDDSAGPSGNRLSRRAILTIIAVAFVLGLVSSWVVNRL